MQEEIKEDECFDLGELIEVNINGVKLLVNDFWYDCSGEGCQYQGYINDGVNILPCGKTYDEDDEDCKDSCDCKICKEVLSVIF